LHKISSREKKLGPSKELGVPSGMASKGDRKKKKEKTAGDV